MGENTTNPLDGVVTTGVVMRRAQLSHSTLMDHITTGRLQVAFRGPGGVRYFREEDVERFLREHRRNPRAARARMAGKEVAAAAR